MEAIVNPTTLTFKSSKGGTVGISFQRTLKIPDDGKNYPYYKEKVPSKWADYGVHAFFCMYQREAMWMQFHHNGTQPNVLKVGVGRVNAINGEEWKDDLVDGVNDYLVLPSQPWLDGIATGEGTIKQFVAMPLGSGYTVESQITGDDHFGGIQILCYEANEDIKLPGGGTRRNIENYSQGNTGYNNYNEGNTITDLKESILDWWRYTNHVEKMTQLTVLCCCSLCILFFFVLCICCPLICPLIFCPIFCCCCCFWYHWRMLHIKRFQQLDNIDLILHEQSAAPEAHFKINKSLFELGIAAGGKMKQKIMPDKYGFSAWNKESGKPLFVQICNSKMFEEITGEKAPPCPVSAKTYTDHGYPWFDYYAENFVEGVGDESGILANIKSVKEIDEERGLPEEDNESVEIDENQVIKIGGNEVLDQQGNEE